MKKNLFLSFLSASLLLSSTVFASTNKNKLEMMPPGPFTISGNVLKPSDKSQITYISPAPATAKLVNTSTTTQTFYSSYSFTAPQYSSNTVTLTKNNDVAVANGVTSVDAALIQSHILGKTLLNSPYKIIAADVDGSGVVDSMDIVNVRSLILGTSTTFTNVYTGVNRLWVYVDNAYTFPDSTHPFPYKDSIHFDSLNSNKISQNFVGIKLGDVNWSWNSAIARQIPTSSPINMTYDNIKNESGNFSIPFRVQQFKNIQGLNFTLNYDETKMKFLGIKNNTMGIEYAVQEGGKVSFMWLEKNSDGITLDDGAIFFEPIFELKSKSSDIQLDLSNDITPIEAVDGDFNSHNILLSRNTNSIISSINKERCELLQNPVNQGLIKVLVNVNENKTVTLKVIDAAGRVILLSQKRCIVGNNTFELSLEKGAIQKGVYYLQTIGLEESNDSKSLLVE